jgi:DNA-binding response OmpR family regulator
VPKALIIEDDVRISEDLKNLLQMNGWKSETCGNGADGLQLLTQFSYDLLLLDWCLPELTGLEICKSIRARGITVPVVFITAQSDIDSTEAGLEAGGDDYLTKPFNERELMARIKSVMRRPRAILELDVLESGGLVFDEKKRSINYKGQTVQLTATEHGLIGYLWRHRDESFTAAQLLAANWQSDSEVSEDSVRVHIRILRKKLELAAMPPLVVHKRGFGYSIELPG